jgi:hypothetical protein
VRPPGVWGTNVYVPHMRALDGTHGGACGAPACMSHTSAPLTHTPSWRVPSGTQSRPHRGVCAPHDGTCTIKEHIRSCPLTFTLFSSLQLLPLAICWDLGWKSWGPPPLIAIFFTQIEFLNSIYRNDINSRSCPRCCGTQDA